MDNKECREKLVSYVIQGVKLGLKHVYTGIQVDNGKGKWIRPISPDNSRDGTTRFGKPIRVPDNARRVPIQPRYRDVVCRPPVNIKTASKRNAIHVDKWFDKAPHMKVRDVRLVPGQVISVLVLDRNFLDTVSQRTPAGRDKTPENFFKMCRAWIKRGEDLKWYVKYNYHEKWQLFEFQVLVNGRWGPVGSSRITNDTKVGWRGPFVLWERIKELPRVYWT